MRSEVSGLIFTYFAILRKNLSDHVQAVMSPSFLFWLSHFLIRSTTPGVGESTGGNRLLSSVCMGLARAPQPPVTATGPWCAKQANGEDMEAKVV